MNLHDSYHLSAIISISIFRSKENETQDGLRTLLAEPSLQTWRSVMKTPSLTLVSWEDVFIPSSASVPNAGTRGALGSALKALPAFNTLALPLEFFLTPHLTFSAPPHCFLRKPGLYPTQNQHCWELFTFMSTHRHLRVCQGISRVVSTEGSDRRICSGPFSLNMATLGLCFDIGFHVFAWLCLSFSSCKEGHHTWL